MLINFTPVRARLVRPTARRVSLKAHAAFITVQPFRSCREHKGGADEKGCLHIESPWPPKLLRLTAYRRAWQDWATTCWFR